MKSEKADGENHRFRSRSMVDVDGLCSAPQDFVVLGVWCLLRALPSSREASYFSDFILSFAKNL
jgi:hypothetical protein